MTPTRPTFDGILGVAYDEANCWEVARMVLDRFGVPAPVDPAAALLGEMRFAEVVTVAEIQAGDVLIMAGEDSAFGMHVGVAIDGLRFIHTIPGSAACIDRIEVWRRAGKILRVARPRLFAVAGDRRRYGS